MPVPLSEAKARLSELARRVRLQHERITLTRNGEAEAVLLSVDDLEGLEMTLEILGDSESAACISESLAALGRGEPGADLATVRQTWPGAAPQVGDRPAAERYDIRFQPGARWPSPNGCPRPSPQPSWNSATPRLPSIRTASASRCPAWPAATAPPQNLPDRVPQRRSHPHHPCPRHRPPHRHLPPAEGVTARQTGSQWLLPRGDSELRTTIITAGERHPGHARRHPATRQPPLTCKPCPVGSPAQPVR